MAFPGDVLWDGQRGYHAPDKAAIEKYHNERNDDEHTVATDEAAHDEEEVESIYECTGSNVCRIWPADTPGDQSTC